jgi:hypothetical protein
MKKRREDKMAGKWKAKGRKRKVKERNGAWGAGETAFEPK